MLKERQYGRLQAAALVVVALVMGANLIAPAVAHVTTKVNHLFKHADPRYYNEGEKVGDADTLDGQNSTAFLGSKPMLAVVDENFAVVRSTGGVTVNRVGAGLFRLTFPQNVTQCTAIASIEATTAGNNVQVGMVGATPAPSIGSNIITVATFDEAGAFTDKPFAVAVFC